MASLLNRNPELKRNLWLEMQPSRLLIMPFVLGLIYVLVYAMKGYDTSTAEALWRPSLLIFGVLVFIWGNRQASEAVIGEVNDETWSFQRMTSIGPWQMAIGKLFGSTAYTWYGASFAVAVYVISSLALPDSLQKIKLIALFILIGILSHSLSIALSLIGIRKNVGKAKIKSNFYFIVSLLFSVSLASNAASIFVPYVPEFDWYSLKISLTNFLVITILIYAFWSVVGLYRAMRTELQFDSKPWVWLLFMLSIMFYNAGVASGVTILDFPYQVLIGLYIALLIPLTLTYFMVFSEPKDVVNFRMIFERWRQNDMDGVLNNVPLWLVSMLLAYAVAAALFVFSLIHPTDHAMLNRIDPDMPPFTDALIPVNLMLLMTRDVAVLLFLNLADNKKRADMTGVLYLVVLYLLLPGILAAADADFLVMAFWPTYKASAGIGSTVMIAIQAVAAFILLVSRWRAKNSQLSEKLN